MRDKRTQSVRELGVMALLVSVSGVLLSFSLVSSAIPAAAATEPSSGCATGSGSHGSVTVCPAAGPVGTSVTLSGTGCRVNAHEVAGVFLGPKDFFGAGGGGERVSTQTLAGSRFVGRFVIPANYTANDPTYDGKSVPSSPGQYLFGFYPAGQCSVQFTVTASTLPFTGTAAPTTALTITGMGLAGAGATLSLLGRRRRKPHKAS